MQCDLHEYTLNMQEPNNCYHHRQKGGVEQVVADIHREKRATPVQGWRVQNEKKGPGGYLLSRNVAVPSA